MVEIFLRDMRRKKRMTTKALSEISGVSRAHIISIESGKSSPTIDVICKLAMALDVPPCYLYHCN